MAYTTIDDPTAFFQAVTYTGNGATGRSIVLPSDTDMQPDWVWVKSRGEAEHHQLTDSVRGVNKQLYSHLTYAEATETDRITAFNSDGFTIQDDIIVNKNSIEFVAWCWKAGTSFTNDASSTGIGTIDSAGSASSDAGFSIVSYTGNGTSGATVKHGLSTALDVIFIKNRDEAEAWQTYHRPLGATHHLSLNVTDSAQDNDSRFNDVHPTSSVFTLGNNDTVNKNNVKFIAYCFAEKKGYSKFGSYTGNASTNGRFVYTGFKPAFVIFKKSAGTGSWAIQDNKRTPFNVQQKALFANASDAESNSADNNVDFLSNGFKFKSDTANYNTNGDVYIYIAFAEAPFVNSKGVPVNAR